jgi:hypothetical protein
VTGRGQAAVEHLPGLEQARGWIGFKLDEASGTSAGRIEDVLVDPESGDPTWLVFRIGRFGRRSAVPFDLAAAAAERVWVPYAKELIRSAPEVDPSSGLAAEQELALCDHFGLASKAGRRGRIEGRRGAPTSVPASQLRSSP